MEWEVWKNKNKANIFYLTFWKRKHYNWGQQRRSHCERKWIEK